MHNFFIINILSKMRVIITVFVAFATYMILTIGSGSILLWAYEEILAGVIIAVLVGIVAKDILCKTKNYRMLNPLRWLMFLIYLIGPFFFAMIKANLDVAYRVITGKINPGIVKISTGLKTDLGTTLLANSITLTPGTLSVDVDENNNDLYIHWINVRDKVPKAKDICGNFIEWVKRIAEND